MDMPALLDLQTCDLRVIELKRERKDVPARKAEELNRLDDHRTRLAEAEDGLMRAQAAVKQVEVDVQAHQERIAKLRQQQMALKSNEEFRAMDHQIATAREAVRAAEDRQLVLMENVETARRDVAGLRAALTEEEAAVAADIAELDQRMTVLDADLREAETARAAATVRADPTMTKRYRAILARRQPAIVPLQGGICGGCHMTLPPAVHQVICRSEDLVACEYCGRVLYLP